MERKEQGIVFRSHFVNAPEAGSVDCSSKFVHTKIRVEPFTKDPVTGEVLNDTNHVIYIRGEDKNVYDEIQSYADEGDIQVMLKRIAAQGIDPLNSGLPVRGVYADISGIPKEPIDQRNFVKKELSKDKFGDITNEDLSQALDQNKLQQFLDSYLNKKFEELNKVNTTSEEEKGE